MPGQHARPDPPPPGGPSASPYADALSQVAALGERIGALAAEQTRLADEQRAAESALFGRVADDLAHHRIADDDLPGIYAAIRQQASSGWTRRWEAAMPGTLRPTQTALWWEQNGHRYTPNAACGSWRGPWPLSADDPRPPTGTAVVYIVYDGDQIVYYGSSDHLLTRLRAAAAAGPVTRWCAYPCQNRELAYRVEDRLLKRRCPPRNARAGR